MPNLSIVQFSILIQCWGKDGAVWFGTVLAFVSFRGPTGRLGNEAYMKSPSGDNVGLAVYVKCYEEEPHTERTKHLSWSRLKRSTEEKENPDGGIEKVEWNDLIAVKEIIRPVLIQKDPTSWHGHQRWFYMLWRGANLAPL